LSNLFESQRTECGVSDLSEKAWYSSHNNKLLSNLFESQRTECGVSDLSEKAW